MVKRKIKWTKNSEIQLQQILEFYIRRNKSSAYSKKLYGKIQHLKKVASNPEIGIKTKLDAIRGIIVENYIVFYEILNDKIIVLKIWDSRQNPKKLDIPK
ncbi:MAG: type II toxin-antitoxin system RelE/ParE family toxin [Chitinophagales bacterium]